MIVSRRLQVRGDVERVVAPLRDALARPPHDRRRDQHAIAADRHIVRERESARIAYAEIWLAEMNSASSCALFSPSSMIKIREWTI